MNQEVPHPVTATRSPRAGSTPVTPGASPAARCQQAGCEATSASMLPAPAPVRVLSPVGSPPRIVVSSPTSALPHAPASPVAATGRMKYRWAAKKITSIGTRLITLPAINSVHSVACAPWNVASPSGTLIWSVEVTAISGHRKLFHESRNVSAGDDRFGVLNADDAEGGNAAARRRGRPDDLLHLRRWH